MKLILEGANEREITLLTRYFVKNSIEVIKNNKEFTSISITKDQDIFPDKLKVFLNSVTFKIGNIPKHLRQGPRTWYYQKAIRFNDAYFESDDKSVVIEILLNPLLFDITMTNELISRIKNVISHEIQHAYQMHFKKEMYESDDYDPEKVNDSFESFKDYWLLPTEVEANAKGIYKKAKHLRIPFTEALDRFIDLYIKDYTDVNYFGNEYKDLLIDLFDYHLRSAILEYAIKNFPASQVSESLTIIKKIIEEELKKV